MAPIFPDRPSNPAAVMAMEAPIVPAAPTVIYAPPVVTEIPSEPAKSDTMMIVSSLAAVALLGFGFYYFSTKR